MTVLVIGAGGHAKVVIEALRRMNEQIIGTTDADPAKHGSECQGVPVLGGDEVAHGHGLAGVLLANGIGPGRSPEGRRAAYRRFKDSGYEFLTVIHPSATIAAGAELGEGAQVMAGAVIQPAARIGINAIINTGATVDHDCAVASHAHVAPGATLCGAVTVADGAFIGAGATVIQGIRIGADATIGAGAVVIGDVAPGAAVNGVPAKRAN